ncbi:hypothetical protein [Ramlibacter sp. WS9]|uniref:hypothetical protein n=1 Tax=Ramlibacter sp. WS9 TaxID=1882741 RepID=UPI00114311F3|nr:hypothetical protein [Ramlibacter sp. WS9]ROZ72440.1 hypothetical protein EEB15_19590 [Ramlibacter sp. WS9]
MAPRLRNVLKSILVCGSVFAAALGIAQDSASVNTNAENLIVVLRESKGANKQDETLRPFGKVRGVLADGREIELDTSWYKYLGDMHIRLVFDGGQSMQSASSQDLARLRLSPDEALKVAVSNLKRLYGAPAAQPWSGALMQVQSESTDLNSSYFLDREFWRELQAQHPQGLVVAVPRRGGLVYAPVSDEAAVADLRFGAAALYAGGGSGARLSSALYLFKDGRWSVFQPAIAQADTN